MDMSWEEREAQNLEHEARTAPELDRFFTQVYFIESTYSWHETYTYPELCSIHFLIGPFSGNVTRQFMFTYNSGYVEQEVLEHLSNSNTWRECTRCEANQTQSESGLCEGCVDA